jgi:uncharacterized protein YgiM (DUF1202 family)
MEVNIWAQPRMSDNPSGFLQSGKAFLVSEMFQSGQELFLRLADGAGWVQATFCIRLQKGSRVKIVTGHHAGTRGTIVRDDGSNIPYEVCFDSSDTTGWFFAKDLIVQVANYSASPNGSVQVQSFSSSQSIGSLQSWISMPSPNSVATPLQTGCKVKIAAGHHKGTKGTIVRDDGSDIPYQVRLDNDSEGWFFAKELKIQS